MLKGCKFNERTMIIVSLSFCIGVGLTQTSGNFSLRLPAGGGGYLQRERGGRCVCDLAASEPAASGEREGKERGGQVGCGTEGCGELHKTEKLSCVDLAGNSGKRRRVFCKFL